MRTKYGASRCPFPPYSGYCLPSYHPAHPRRTPAAKAESLADLPSLNARIEGIA
jgi:hypothetical protein